MAFYALSTKAPLGIDVWDLLSAEIIKRKEREKGIVCLIALLVRIGLRYIFILAISREFSKALLWVLYFTRYIKSFTNLNYKNYPLKLI